MNAVVLLQISNGDDAPTRLLQRAPIRVLPESYGGGLSFASVSGAAMHCPDIECGFTIRGPPVRIVRRTTPHRYRPAHHALPLLRHAFRRGPTTRARPTHAGVRPGLRRGTRSGDPRRQGLDPPPQDGSVRPAASGCGTSERRLPAGLSLLRHRQLALRSLYL